MFKLNKSKINYEYKIKGNFELDHSNTYERR